MTLTDAIVLCYTIKEKFLLQNRYLHACLLNIVDIFIGCLFLYNETQRVNHKELKYHIMKSDVIYSVKA